MKIWAAISLLFWGTINLSAQSPSTTYRLYTLKDGLAQMKIHCLLEDELGNIWIGTRNGLSKFNGESFMNYYTIDGLAGNRIYDMFLDDLGNLMVLSNGGLSSYNGEKFKTIIPYEHHEVSGGIVALDSLGFFFHHYYYSLKDNTVDKNREFPLPIADKHSTGELIQIGKSLVLNDTLQDVYGTYQRNFINTTAHTLYINDTDRNKIHFYFKNAGPQQFLLTSELPDYWSFEEASLPAGVFFVNYLTNRIIGLRQNGTTFDFQAANAVTTIIESKNGEILIGSEFGLYVIPPNWFKDFSNKQLPYVWSVIESDAGDYITNSWDHGLHHITKNFEISKEHIAVFDTISTPWFHPDRFLLKSAKDQQGNLYFPHQSGIVQKTSDQYNYLDFPISYFSVHYDDRRNQIIGSIKGGLGILINESITHINFSQQGISKEDYFNDISQDTFQRYWFNNYSKLLCYDPDSQVFIDFGKQHNDIVNKGSFGMLQQGSLLWLGLNEGMAKIDVKTMAFKKIESVVLSSMVKDITEYNDSLFLIGAKDGLYLFDYKRYLTKDQVDIWPLNESHGYTGIEPGFDCFYTDSKGDIWITSASHLSILTPSEDLLNKTPLNPNFIKINGQGIQFNDAHSTYLINDGNNDVQLQYEACGLTRPSKVLFKYQLNNEPVSEWLVDTKLFLDDLPHGIHELKLWAGPTDLNLEHLPMDYIKFKVHLPIWQRTWFQWLIGILSFTTLLYFSINFYLLRRRQELYTRNIKENQYLKNQILLSELNPHFIFNALSAIQSNILKEDKLLASKQVVRLSKLIRSFLNSNYSGNSFDRMKTAVLLSEEIKLLEYYLSFEKEKHKNKFDFEIHHANDLDLEDLQIPPMIIQPLVENSIKHGILPLKNKKGKIDLFINFQNETLEITIEDNGIGVEAAEKRNKNKIGKNTSLGTKIIKERIEVLKKLGHDIQLNMESSPEGTRVKIELLHE